MSTVSNSKYISHVELAVSHRVPPQVADRGMLNTYIGEGYQGNKILGTDKTSRYFPASVVGSIGAKGMGPRQKNSGRSRRVLRMKPTTSFCRTSSETTA
jgi:hypothetical protein